MGYSPSRHLLFDRHTHTIEVSQAAFTPYSCLSSIIIVLTFFSSIVLAEGRLLSTLSFHRLAIVLTFSSIVLARTSYFSPSDSDLLCATDGALVVVLLCVHDLSPRFIP